MLTSFQGTLAMAGSHLIMTTVWGSARPGSKKLTHQRSSAFSSMPFIRGQTLEVCPPGIHAIALLAIRMPPSLKQDSACSPATSRILHGRNFGAFPLIRTTLLFLGDDAHIGFDRWHAATKHLGSLLWLMPPGSIGYLSICSLAHPTCNRSPSGVVPS